MNRAARYESAGCDPESDVVRRYAPLLDRCARRLSMRTGGAVSADDLWSSGAMGLLDAWRRFDSARDVKFETFADHRIRGAMLDEMRRMDHLPRRLRAETEKAERERARLGHTLGREPTADEVAEALGAPLEEVCQVLTLLEPAMPISDELAQTDTEGVDARLDRKRLERVLATAIGLLPDRLKILLALYYDEGLTYREISKVMGVSEPRVCQLHSEAVKRLHQVVEPA